MYIDFEYYKENGGTASEAAFPAWEKKARYKLDYYTQNRVKALTPVPENVKDCMVELVNLFATQGQGEKVSGFSNDGVSVSFEQSNDEQDAYSIILQMLPGDLLYLGGTI